jgi:hypothetical protein
MKRIVSLIILVSMMLHCASRLGVISYLYQQRHQIAYQVGLIAEIPIALCDSDHDFSGELKIQHHDNDEKLPATFTQAPEIQLFFQEVNFEFNLPGHPELPSTGKPYTGISVTLFFILPAGASTNPYLVFFS